MIETFRLRILPPGIFIIGFITHAVISLQSILCREMCDYFQIGLPLPGRPRDFHFSVTVRMTLSSIAIFLPHSRCVSGGSLLVASRPIFEPRPLSGEAKSR